jgi:hypothetical protein
VQVLQEHGILDRIRGLPIEEIIRIVEAILGLVRQKQGQPAGAQAAFSPAQAAVLGQHNLGALLSGLDYEKLIDIATGLLAFAKEQIKKQ